MSDSPSDYVSRGGVKLAHALHAFDLEPRGWVCVDFGSHTGGFVDCLLQSGAARVYAVEPGRGVLDDRLRRDPRVVVFEGVNALRFTAPEPADLITIDVGWTPQRLVLPAARRCLKPDGRVVTLVKPHYEAPKGWLRRGVLAPEHYDQVLETCRTDVREAGWTIVAETESPLTGHAGNREHFFLLRRTD